MVTRLICFALFLLAAKVLYAIIPHGTDLGRIYMSANLPPAAAPVQVTVARKQLALPAYSMEFFAAYELDALVLSVKNYSDRKSELAPVDVVIGWGALSLPQGMRGVVIYQKNRSYDIIVQSGSLLEAQRARSISANTHVISATRDIETVVKRLRPGQRVQMAGFLANVKARDGWSWTSSRSRNDLGENASEVFYVTNIRVI